MLSADDESRSSRESVCHAFGDFEFFPSKRKLLLRGQPVAVGARALDVLTTLIELRDRMVSKNELLDLVWPGLVVEENNVQVQISALRKLLGPDVIATNPGRGYQFTAALLDNGTSGSLEASRLDTLRPGAAPRLASPLIGRENELRELCALIMRCPLVTVVGTGGIGKTSLALAAVDEIGQAFGDGAWFVDLTPVSNGAELPQTIAQALRVPLAASADAVDLLGKALRSKRLLLVLDNCERLGHDVAALAQRLVERAPGVRVVATSQEVLHAHAETLFRVGPLQTPVAGDVAVSGCFGAVQLFAERAGRVQSDFALSPQNTPAVCEICRRLDGLPLAIELAAARVRVMGVHGLLEHLGDRFKILTGGARTAVPRHQTLWAAIDWSHDLLSPEERRTLRRLAVFVQGFSLELAQGLVGDASLSEWAVLDVLSALIDKSFIVCEPGAVQRYRLLESTRAYALDRLDEAGERDATRRRHAIALRDWLLRGDEQRMGDAGTLTFNALMARMIPEYENLRAAAAWAASPDGDIAVAIDIAAGSEALFRALGRSAEAWERLEALMERIDDSRDALARARFQAAAAYLGARGRMTSAEVLSAASSAAAWFEGAGHRRRACEALYTAGWAFLTDRRFAEAESIARRLQDMLEPSDPLWLRANLLNLQASIHLLQWRFEVAAELFEEIRESCMHAHDEPGILMRSIDNLCAARNCLGNFQAVLDIFESTDRLRGNDLVANFGYSEFQRLHAQTMLGQLAQAQRTLKLAMPRWERDDRVLFGAAHLANLLAVQGRHADAVRVDGADQAHLERCGLQLSPVRTLARENLLRVLREAGHDAATLQRWRREGSTLDSAAVANLCVGD